jgi:hypothetical protein
MREVIAGLVVLVSLVLIPGSAFAYWDPDSYGQGMGRGPGLTEPQGGYPGDNLSGLPSLPWLGNILAIPDLYIFSYLCFLFRSVY